MLMVVLCFMVVFMLMVLYISNSLFVPLCTVVRDAFYIKEPAFVPSACSPLGNVISSGHPLCFRPKVVPWNCRGVAWTVRAALVSSHAWGLQHLSFEVLVTRHKPATSSPTISQVLASLDKHLSKPADAYVYWSMSLSDVLCSWLCLRFCLCLYPCPCLCL